MLAVFYGLWVWRLGVIFDQDLNEQRHWTKLTIRVQTRIRTVSLAFQYDDDPRLSAAARRLLAFLDHSMLLSSVASAVPFASLDSSSVSLTTKKCVGRH